MVLESPATILARAKTVWKANAAHNRRIVLIYMIPALVLPLLVMAINLILDGQLAATGGLSGIGLRSTLETVQAVMTFAIQVFLPFWNLGLIYSALTISRDRIATTANLFEGFRRWGAALRLMLFRTFRYTFGCLCGIFLGSLLFTATPLSGNFLKISQALAQDPAYSNASPEVLMEAVVNAVKFWDIAPYYILCVLGAACLTIPMFFHYRMSDYVLLDSEKPGALPAATESTYMMRGNAKRLFAIDLRLWWYYLPLFLSTVIAYGDLLLPMLGIALPFSDHWAMIIFSLLSTAMQFALFYLFRGQVETVYACVYTSLKESKGGKKAL